MKSNLITSLIAAVVVFTIMLFSSGRVFAHCDGMDGPVVKAAQKALETDNVNLVLIWVQKADEVEIRKAFEQTLKVRKLSPEAKQMADMYFFETKDSNSSLQNCDGEKDALRRSRSHRSQHARGR